ncbi:aminotransferase class I/II-fold pyridoxal phosphate-dependent enzyme [Candidatus Desantisbacteria bacterium]|nr:aminotransferase class I/II-fold pyridoxal phosphate-dependent enzyme [Candidatus Desantisbacteria bacterium]
MSSLKIKYFDCPLQFKTFEKEYLKIVKNVCLKGIYILGEDLNKFEENLAKFLGVKYAIGVSNCTDALLLSLYASGIRPGDEVITVSHTFIATIEVIRFLGAKPILIDINDDHDMDIDLLNQSVQNINKNLPEHLDLQGV